MRETVELIDRFIGIFGEKPELVAFAPGRVNLIGEHTDYNGGHVFPCALTLGVSCAARPRNDRILRFASLDLPGEIIETDLDSLLPLSRRVWTAYPEGVIHSFIEEGFRIDTGADMLFYGDIPSGVGLSSSAAVEVATGVMLREMFGLRLSSERIAQLCQRAENRYVGVSCGIMDQFASSMGRNGHAIFLDTHSLLFEYAPLAMEDAEIVIVDSRVKHSLAGSAYNDRRRECEEALAALSTVLDIDALCHITPDQFEAVKDVIADPICRRRAKHAVYENARTVAALEALDRGDLFKFGRLMNESHVSLRDDYEVSCPELDVLTEIAWSIPGVIGARMTGGGFGGCMVAIVEKASVEEFTAAVSAGYEAKTGLKAGFICVQPGDGAHIIKN